ncbi:thrombospondin type 3 repeat-containing protein [Lutimonas halocynthiae]|uniref:thrombospondin type 3 repeat-containing protein n=1 Tax=Lutimonas halocynthiae TaxID=1446477 RepID=UPI0025B4A57A|nr:thrombospondin type 3 repeat-containing protein [Lutimonas halocynthiae]MDN3641842.1 thrombospondin type 3 repeat-containing protein [Lutimonas halocynthiae]
MIKLTPSRIKTILALFILFLPFIMVGQVSIETIPLDKELVARDLTTNLGEVVIGGFVDKSGSSSNYDAIEVAIFKNDDVNQISSEVQALDYDGGNTASFSIKIYIKAELTNYSFKVYGKVGNVRTAIPLPEGTGNEVVAGDVYIIQGQSNAVAFMQNPPNESANANQNNFIRTFASAIGGDGLLRQMIWNQALGDGSPTGNEGEWIPGFVGQWGLKLGKMILDAEQVPIAIFNGARAARPINFFLKNAPEDQPITKNNYNRLLIRLNETGLKNNVRALFWSQGEADWAQSTDEYYNAFLSLKADWQEDYPSIKEYYIFQSKSACGTSSLMEIKEAQRRLAVNDTKVHIMQTAALIYSPPNGNIDCHFGFTGGYEEFAKRIYKLVKRDFYNGLNESDIETPMITNSYLLDDKTLILETDASGLVMNNPVENFKIENAGSSTITDIQVSGNNIVIKLSDYPGPNASISHLGFSKSIVNSGNYITNTKNLELVSFNKFPIEDAPLAIDTDNDGVNDDNDICPDTPAGETVNSNGCSDSQLDDDNDGVMNNVDQCANTPNGESVNSNGCSTSQLDTDNDGVNDNIDTCPNTPADQTVNSSGCSDSQLDDDNDGVMNNVDQCANTPNGESVNSSGCSTSQLDSDIDGVNDNNDLCQNTPSGEIVNANGCSDSQLDDDNDGMMNNVDQCANTPNGESVNSSGCSTSQLDSDIDGVNDNNDLCQNTPSGEIVNANGCSDSQLDDDNDGVMNNVDQCANTPNGESVNSNGCSSSQLDSDNDAVNDNIDTCPNTPTGETVNSNGCSDSQLDDDNDGVMNNVDQCANTPNGESVNSNGCSTSQLDTDNDGVNDNIDTCPNTPTGENVNANGCSDSQLDDDNDGVMNNVDQCANTPNGESVNSNGCSISQLDTDNDGVNDNIDTCPNTPAGETVNANGCSDSQLDDDNDGVMNNVDQCANTPNGESVNSNGCSTSQLDTDNDGVNDNIDTCPNTPTGENVNANGCSDSQLDDDNDGVMNNVDQCANTPNGNSVDGNGCSDSQLDDDNDGVMNDTDQCPGTLANTAVNPEGCSESQTLGIEDQKLDKSIKFYPNPVSNSLSIQSESILIEKVEIYSYLGIKIIEIDSGFEQVQTDNLTKGMYIIKIYSEKGSVVRRLIKK